MTELRETYETVIGLEVHAELRTETKIFCGCSTRFGAAPNTLCCPVCTGQPGSLPRLNRRVVEHAIAAGLVLDCRIRRETRMDRKNYFYPDLPKSYQISQLYAPICCDGAVRVCSPQDAAEEFTVRIHEMHMEEDAGKLIHSEDGKHSLVDYNRCGVPLLEIVTEPDLRSAEQVVAFLKELRDRLLYAGISDCRMQEGSMRVDVNLSVHKPGTPLGTRTEMKNLSSFRSVRQAIAAETERQLAVLAAGGAVRQETRRFDEASGESVGMRSKENAEDYRYFSEPDLPLIRISPEWIAQVKASLPKSRRERQAYYASAWGLSAYDAELLTEDADVADFFERTAAAGAPPKEARKFILTELLRVRKEGEPFPVTPEALAELLRLLADGRINRTTAKEIFTRMLSEPISPAEYVKAQGLSLVSDEAALRETAERILRENPEAVQDYRNGKQKAIGYLVGQTMKALRGRGQAERIRGLLEEALGRLE